MKVKLSDTANTEIVVSSVSQNYYGSAANEGEAETSFSITINNPEKEFDYYKELFTNDSIKSIKVINSRGNAVTTISGSKINSISYNYQDENPSFVNIQII